MARRRSSLVAIQNKDSNEGAVPPAGWFIMFLVIGAIGAFWWNEFQIDEDAMGEVTIYRTGAAGGSSGHRGKVHIAVPKVSSLKDCEKVVSEALKDYVDKQTAVIDEEEEKPKKGKKGDAKKKAQEDDEDEVKSKKGKGKKK